MSYTNNNKQQLNQENVLKSRCSSRLNLILHKFSLSEENNTANVNDLHQISVSLASV